MAVEDAHVLPCERGFFQRLGDHPEIFRRMMLHDPDFRHFTFPFEPRLRSHRGADKLKGTGRRNVYRISSYQRPGGNITMGLVGLPAIAFCREKTLRDTE